MGVVEGEAEGHNLAHGPKTNYFMLTFDGKGHVCPYQVNEITLEEFRNVFVENMDNKAYRASLFDRYLEFNGSLKKAFGVSYFQWIDGSFTTKKPIPGDIDVVTFMEYDHLVRNAVIIRGFSENAKKIYSVDAHFAVTCSWRHRFHERALKDQKLWKKIFGFSRADDFGVKHPKGLIRINF